MIEFIPYILVLISWHADDPEASMKVSHRYYADVAECELHGNEYVEQRRIYREEFGKMRFSYSCIKTPSGEEYRRLIEPKE